MQNDANGSEIPESAVSLLEALTTTNLLLAQMAQDLAVIAGIVQGAIVEPVDGQGGELPDRTPCRSELFSAGIHRLEDIPITIAQIRDLGFSDTQALSIGLFRDNELRARRQHT